MGADGAYTANAAANHIGAATSLVNADDILDAAIKAVQDDVDGNESDADTAISDVQDDVDQNESDSDQADADLQTELDGTQTGAGWEPTVPTRPTLLPTTSVLPRAW